MRALLDAFVSTVKRKKMWHANPSSAPFTLPPLHHNYCLTVCVPEGSEAQQSDQGYVRSGGEERLITQSGFPRKQLRGTGREESGLEATEVSSGSLAQ